jgi:hypothetical protein
VIGLVVGSASGYGRVFLPDMDDAGAAKTAAPSRFFHDLRELLRMVAIRAGQTLLPGFYTLVAHADSNLSRDGALTPAASTPASRSR